MTIYILNVLWERRIHCISKNTIMGTGPLFYPLNEFIEKEVYEVLYFWRIMMSNTHLNISTLSSFSCVFSTSYITRINQGTNGRFYLIYIPNRPLLQIPSRNPLCASRTRWFYRRTNDSFSEGLFTSPLKG